HHGGGACACQNRVLAAHREKGGPLIVFRDPDNIELELWAFGWDLVTTNVDCGQACGNCPHRASVLALTFRGCKGLCYGVDCSWLAISSSSRSNDSDQPCMCSARRFSVAKSPWSAVNAVDSPSVWSDSTTTVSWSSGSVG